MMEWFQAPFMVMYASSVAGSLGIELAALLRNLSASDGQLPAKYKTLSYPIFRVLFAFIGAGPLAVMMDARTGLIAFYIGISAPLIYDRAAAGIKLGNSDD